jgi:hypothetical protein
MDKVSAIAAKNVRADSHRRTRQEAEVVRFPGADVDDHWAGSGKIRGRYRLVRRRPGSIPRSLDSSQQSTFTTWLIQSGLGISKVQKLMGLSSAVVTRVHAYLAPSELHSAVGKISLSLTGGGCFGSTTE